MPDASPLTDAELREFTLLPFWFWNDDLDEATLLAQIDDFQAHGVHGFVIHPRVGLPRSIGWMSDRMLHFVRFAVEAAAERGMRVVLYDEGMYPSGSSCGQVVAENPAFACRGLSAVHVPAGTPAAALPEGHCLVATFDREDGRTLIVDRPVASVIRGLHFVGDGPDEDTPPAADLLNPQAVAAFVRLVYDRLYSAVGQHFGTTVIGMFTDEPDLLGRLQEPAEHIAPGTTGIVEHVSAYLGYDFTPHLPALFDDAAPDAALPDAAVRRADYLRAVNHRLEQTYYAQLSAWCRSHGVDLMGHPARPDELGLMKYFDVPGQDLVWRWVLPGRTALEGAQSTQAKCSSSAMVHLGRRRNSNEFCGAYGHELSFEEMRWLANWCIVRGVNLLIPHAFYYSQRGPRRDERPPDVGPNSPWWGDRFAAFARACAEGCWLNTDSRQVCDVAIWGSTDALPWASAKACFEHQIDFNYLSAEDLTRATVTEAGIEIAGMHYAALVVEDAWFDALPDACLILQAAGRLVRYGGAGDLVQRLDALVDRTVRVEPAAPDLRCRRVVKNDRTHTLLFNEGVAPLAVRVFVDDQAVDVVLEPGDLRVHQHASASDRTPVPAD